MSSALYLQSSVRTQALDAVVQLYRQVSPELRWATQRVFYGGASRLKAVYDPWLDLTPYIIEGLTAEETELYVWEAHLVCTVCHHHSLLFRIKWIGTVLSGLLLYAVNVVGQ
jgi:hypothetical protein